MGELVQTLLRWVADYGFLAVFVLMTLESACIPVPSEPVMVYGGYLVFTGHMTFVGAALAGTLGNLAGSMLAYLVGIKGGDRLAAFAEQRGVTAHKLKRAHDFFHRYGEPSVLIGRMLPVIRTFISLPAGAAKMDWRRFVIFTVVGSLPWNAGLVWAGLSAGRHWREALSWLHQANYWVLGLAVAAVAVAYAVWRIRGRRRAGGPEPCESEPPGSS